MPRKSTGEVDAFLPLKPVVYLILLTLAENEHHGYGVMRAVREKSEGKLRIETGPLYRHLKQLLDAGIVEETARRPARKNDDDRRRCYYRLTSLGQTVVAAESQRLSSLVDWSRRLGLLAKGGVRR